MSTLARSLRALRRPRALHADERSFLFREFGDSLELGALRLAGGGHPFGRSAWQPLGGLIQMHDNHFEGGDASLPLHATAYPVFAHEALHVWQRRHRQARVNVSVDGLWLGITQGRDAYRYDTTVEDPDALLACFLRCNIEQQGQMFQDYVQSNAADPSARDKKFARIAEYVRAARA